MTQNKLSVDDSISFPMVSYDEWLTAAQQSLKGRSPDALCSVPVDGVRVSPICPAPSDAKPSLCTALPGSFPFVRGIRDPRQASSFRIGQRISATNMTDLLERMRIGAQFSPEELHVPLDPTQASRLEACSVPSWLLESGVHLSDLSTLLPLLQATAFPRHPLWVEARTSGIATLAFLLAACETLAVPSSHLQGAVAVSPVGQLSLFGALPVGLERMFDEMAVVSRYATAHTPGLKTIGLNGVPWHGAGAATAWEVALLLSECVTYMEALQERGLRADDIARSMCATVWVGSRFLVEIAKLRALRFLFSAVVKTYGVAPKSAGLFIYARGSVAVQSARTPHVNILRSVLQTLVAVFGGADSVHCPPYDECLQGAGDISARIAGNVPLMLREEFGLGQVLDPLGGSDALEAMTDQLSEQAWGRFQEIQRHGGVVAALQTGWLQERLEAQLREKQERLRSGAQKMVGVNAYECVDSEPLPMPVDRERASISAPSRHVETQAVDAVERITDGVLTEAVAAVRVGASFSAINARLSSGDGGFRVVPVRTQRLPEAWEERSATGDADANREEGK